MEKGAVEEDVIFRRGATVKGAYFVKSLQMRYAHLENLNFAIGKGEAKV